MYTVRWDGPPSEQVSASALMDEAIGYEDTFYTEREDAERIIDLLNDYAQERGLRGRFLVVREEEVN